MNNRDTPVSHPRWLPLAVILFSRVVIMLVAYLALITLPVRGTPGQFQRFAPENAFLDGFVRWDGWWYFDVAMNGYDNPAHTHQHREVFFPAYPLLIRLVALLGPSGFMAGLVVSNVCFVVAAWLFHRWARLYLEEGPALLALVLLCTYPLTFYFGAMYSESLFLLGAVGAFYFAERGRWPVAALFAALVGATRTVGFLVAPMLVLLYLDKRGYDLRKIRVDILWLGLGTLGTLGYLTFLYFRTGDPFYFVGATHRGWGPSYDMERLSNSLEAFATGFISGAYPPTDILNMGLGVLALGTVLFIWRVLPFPYTFWAFMTLLFSASHWYNIGRYMMVIFPLYVVWAAALAPRPLVRNGVLYVSVMVGSLLTAVWSLWYYVAA